MSKSLCPALFQRFFDDEGLPLAGGLVYTYESGTSTPLETFTDATGNTPNTNPIVLDANGYCDIWLGDTAYKFIVNDADDVFVRMVDPVQSLAAQIAEQINIAGALAAANNLSDVESAPTALINLNIAPFTYQLSHAVTSGQSATNLTGETFDGDDVTAVVYEYLVTQGTTVGAWGSFVYIYINGTWTKFEGIGAGTAHGLTFSNSQSTTVGQLKVAESGISDGTLLLKRHNFYA